MWQKTVEPFVRSGELQVIGVVQEQHAQRARLYAQWRNIDWPIFVDSLNHLNLSVVPVPIALDASGIVRLHNVKPNGFARKFIEVEYPAVSTSVDFNRAVATDIESLVSAATLPTDAKELRKAGDALFVQGKTSAHLAKAIEFYESALTLEPHEGRNHFRLGVALRKRSELRSREKGDAQRAVEHWGRALAINPNQYIWRRRIQQYGPRLDKPYAFYTWIEQARKEIRARGDVPVELRVEPSGSEIAPPAKLRAKSGTITDAKADPADDRIQRDSSSLIDIESVVTPARVQPGQRIRARVTFRANKNTRPYWNNESKSLVVRMVLPEGIALGDGSLTFPNPAQPETQEDRAIEFEMHIPRNAVTAKQSIPAYSLYYVCENKGGKCRYLRQDFELEFDVSPEAPKVR